MKNLSRVLGAALLALSASPCASARDLGCKGNPHAVGRCVWVHGTYSLSGDNGFVLGLDKDYRGVPFRVLPVRDPPGSDQGEPDNLDSTLDKAQRRLGHISVDIHGLFEVCPMPAKYNQIGSGPYVCIDKARHLSTVTRR